MVTTKFVEATLGLDSGFVLDGEYFLKSRVEGREGFVYAIVEALFLNKVARIALLLDGFVVVGWCVL